MVDCLLFLQFCQFLLNKFWGFVVRCIYIYCWYIFLLNLHTIYNMSFLCPGTRLFEALNDAFTGNFILMHKYCSWSSVLITHYIAFWTNHLKTCVQQHLKLALVKPSVPPGRMTKSVLNIFVLFLYWFCQVISVSIPNQLADVISGLLVFPK